MTQLFSNEYFGIGLIITIAFLTILFIIVLIMALKDARKNKQSEEVVKEAKEEPTADFAFKEESPEEKVEISLPDNVVLAPAQEEVKEEVAPVVPEVPTIEETHQVEEVPQVEEVKTPEEVKEEEEFKTADFSFGDLNKEQAAVENEPTVNIDFEALAESLKSELEKENKEEVKESVNSVEVTPADVFTTKEVKEEVPVQNNQDYNANLEELKSFANELVSDLDINKEPVLTNEEETIKVEPASNNDAPVTLLNNEENKVVKEEKVVTPVKMKVPTIEMPKFATVPKDSVKVSTVEPVEDKKEEVVAAPTFDTIENETFSLK